MVYQQTDSQGFHIGQVAELTPGAIDTTAPVYDKATEKAKWDGIKWVVDSITNWSKLPVPTLEQIVATKSEEIDSKAQQYVDSLTPKYPEFEKLTFEKQEQEAKAYLADSTIATPVLTAIATARGLTVLELANRVVTKADQLTQLASIVAGKRQAYQDKLTAATTVEEVEAITVDYGV